MTKTYILERNRPFLANYLDDCIYDLKNEKKNENKTDDESTKKYLEMDGIKKDLVFESKIIERENECIDRLRKSLSEADIIKKAYSDWRSKQTMLKNKQDEIKLINFVNEFFNAWSEYSPQFPIYDFPNEIAEAKTMDFKKFKLNEEKEQSVLKQNLMPASASLFFISGKCYKLAKYDDKQISSVTLNKQKYSLQYVSQIEEFDNTYFGVMQKKFEEKVKKFAITDSEQLKEIDEKYKALEQELQATHKEKNGEVAFMRKDGQNFLYINKESYIIEYGGVKYGWFPKCKIGARIQLVNGQYCYDFNGRERPLILDHDYYEHPAVYGLGPDKKESSLTFNNPTICIGTPKYGYPNRSKWFNESNKKELIGTICQLLHRLQLIHILDTKAMVPHYPSEQVFEKYKNLGVPKT